LSGDILDAIAREERATAEMANEEGTSEFKRQLDDIRTEINAIDLPIVPWFLGYRDYFAKEKRIINERRQEVRLWKTKMIGLALVGIMNVILLLHKLMFSSHEDDRKPKRIHGKKALGLEIYNYYNKCINNALDLSFFS
jgi:hypothetical protein